MAAATRPTTPTKLHVPTITNRKEYLKDMILLK